MGQKEHPGEPGERPRQSLGDAADATSEAEQSDEDIQPTADATVGGAQAPAGGPAGGAGGGGSPISDDTEKAIQDIEEKRARG
jgi:hypothetical protein